MKIKRKLQSPLPIKSNKTFANSFNSCYINFRPHPLKLRDALSPRPPQPHSNPTTHPHHPTHSMV
jgi:hypothetical protein